MRIIRYIHRDAPPAYGWVQDDKLGRLDGSLFAGYRRQKAEINLDEVQILEPVLPSKVICVGRNYASHAAEQNAEIPEIPLLFLKPPTSIISSGGVIILPPQSSRVEHEAELAVVIGKKGRWISPDSASEYIFGYTIANDVTARDLQRSDNQWTRGKGFDTFCPIGPWVETEFDPSDAMITCTVNGELRQMASTKDMIFSIRQLIAFTSSIMTLIPGDILLTGTPSGVGGLQAGDKIEISIEGIGTLINYVNDNRS